MVYSCEDVIASTEAYTKAVFHCLKYPTQPVLGLLIGRQGEVPAAPSLSAAKKNLPSDESSPEKSKDAATTTPESGSSSSRSTNHPVRSSSGGDSDDAPKKQGSEANETTACPSTSKSDTATKPSAPARKMQHGVMVLDVIPLFHSSLITSPHPLVEVALALAQGVAEKDHCNVVGLYVANERKEDRVLSTLLLPFAERLLSAIQEEAHTPQLEKKSTPSSHGDGSGKGGPTEVESVRRGLVLWMMDNHQLTTPPKFPCLSSVWMEKGTSSWEVLKGKVSIPTIVPHRYPASGVEGGDSKASLQHLQLVSPQPRVAAQMKKGASSHPKKDQDGKEATTEVGDEDPSPSSLPSDKKTTNEKATIFSRPEKGEAHYCDLTPARKMNLLFPTDSTDLQCLLSAAFNGHVEHQLVDFEDHLENPTLNFLEQPIGAMLLRSSSNSTTKSK